MTEINDLRQRVEAAEERFGLMDEQQRHYSARLIGLIETIEAQLAAARSEVERQIAENQRLSQENEELRGMLHSVLRSIEQKTFTETLQNLESRVSALVAQGDAPAAPTTTDAAEEDAPVEDAPAMDTMVEPEEATGDDADSLIIEPAAQEETPEGESSAEMTAGDGPTEAEAMADAPVMGDMPTEDMAAEDMVAQDKPEEAASDFEAAGGMNAEITPEAAMEDVAFEDDPLAMAEETGVEDAGVDDPGTDNGGAEYGAAEATMPETPEPEMADAEAADETAPSVKEIIRRVGDLARELEKAEATRKASMSEEAENIAAESPAEGEASGDAPPDGAPPDDAWGQAANG